MVHGYHVIWGTYGFWLPNDPRGSYSDFVASWELARFGKATKSLERTAVDRNQWARWRTDAQQALKYPPVVLSGKQAQCVGSGFAKGVHKSRFCLWACSILPEHIHLVIARHRFEVEKITNLLKGEATKQLKLQSLHPHVSCSAADGKLPPLWAKQQWKVFLDNEEAIDNAIRYVEENPSREGKPPQKWSFIIPFGGIDEAGWVTYV